MATDRRIAGIAGRHFLLSLAVAWPVLWFWSSELSRQAWTWGVLLTVPSILVSSVVVVWSIFAFVVWNDAGTPAPASAGEKVVAIAAGALAVGGWFLFALAALLLVPGVGDAHVGIGGPNPLGLLGALVAGLGVTWFCALVISWHFERAPTVALIACLLSAAAVPCLGVSRYHASQNAEAKDSVSPLRTASRETSSSMTTSRRSGTSDASSSPSARGTAWAGRRTSLAR